MVNNPQNPTILTIPSSVENATDFRLRIANLFQCQGTHIYIDTSFLMWMTKIGLVSRKELKDWLQVNCDGRVHVPIWSAHEYLKHHVSGSISKELITKTREVQRVVGRSYAYFRPFLDSALDEGNPAAFRAEARQALDAVRLVANKIEKWTKSYELNAVDVISFINELIVDKTSIYSEFDNIEQVGNGRYGGLVPPGYRDRHKDGRNTESVGSSILRSAGTNVFGDLIFWKEILFHARHVDAEAVVVITNDRKNDWYMGGGDDRGLDQALRALKREWKPVPRPHPMLAAEARVVANVKQFELVDSVYLAVVLRDVAEQEVQAFADVAIIPDVEVSSEDRDSDEQVDQAGVVSPGGPDSEKGPLSDFIFPSANRVRNTLGTFRRTLLESRKDPSDVVERILRSWQAGALDEDLDPIADDAESDLDHTELATLARELHDRALAGIAGYQEVLVDLVGTLDELPENTAAALYLGLLSSMYLSRKKNDSRIPPTSPVATLLLDRQSKGYSLNGVQVVSNRLRDNDRLPLYLPNGECPEILVELDVEPQTSGLDELRSLTIDGTEVLVVAQGDERLRMSALFGGMGPVSGERIIRKACEVFAVPYSQVRAVHRFQQEYYFAGLIGFKRATDVVIKRGD